MRRKVKTFSSPMPDRFKRLADYNTRVSEGIVHTPEYAAEMAKLQSEFDLLYGQPRPRPFKDAWI